MDDATAQRLDPLTAEFIDPGGERRFREFIRPQRVRDTRLAVSLAALFYLGFALTDFLALGLTRSYLHIFLTRLAICILCLATAALADRYWRALVNGLIPSLISTAAMIGLIAITLLRPYEAGWHGMSMMIMLLGVYVFIPNRFLPALMVAVISSLVFLLLMTEHFHLPLNLVAYLTALLTVINILGAVAAYRISRLQHETYREAAVLAQANAGLQRAMAERQRLEASMRERAERDDVTGLFNRNRFFTLAAELVQAASPATALSLLRLDIDHFKQINMTYGQQRSDEVLRAMATACRHYLDETALFARLEGGEFVLLATGATAAEAMALAERMRDECRRTPVEAGEVSIFFTVSIGVALWQPGEAIESLRRRAEEAMAAAQYQGRNRVVPA